MRVCALVGKGHSELADPDKERVAYGATVFEVAEHERRAARNTVEQNGQPQVVERVLANFGRRPGSHVARLSSNAKRGRGGHDREVLEQGHHEVACKRPVAEHPKRPHHSEADDDLAIVTVAGGLSFVVPKFARDGMRGVSRWACFQLGADGVWRRPADHVSMRIE